LIHRLRDRRPTGEGEDSEEPGGIHLSDKRLLVVETELASVLSRIDRQGNTLSPIIRQAWDDGMLAVLTRKNAERATDTHVSVIGHITCDELRRRLGRTEVANGFANRFLFIAARRSKLLPEGGRIDETYFEAFALRLAKVVRDARNVGEMRRDEDAGALWADVYAELSEDRPGLYGAVVARAEAQVTRLSCIYALLDASRIVRRPHLEAALALWMYADASAQFVFGPSSGEPVEDRLFAALQVTPEGMTRTEIRDLFSRDSSKAFIDAVLSSLENRGLVELRIEKKSGLPGRPVHRWFAKGFASTETTKTTK
jgi:hypothetical protein